MLTIDRIVPRKELVCLDLDFNHAASPLCFRLVQLTQIFKPVDPLDLSSVVLQGLLP